MGMGAAHDPAAPWLFAGAVLVRDEAQIAGHLAGALTATDRIQGGDSGGADRGLSARHLPTGTSSVRAPARSAMPTERPKGSDAGADAGHLRGARNRARCGLADPERTHRDVSHAAPGAGPVGLDESHTLAIAQPHRSLR
jgi:hypothetical protein